MPVLITSSIDDPEDHDIITEFYIQYKMLLYREAWKYLSNLQDVEDIVLETFVRIIDHMEKFRTLLPRERVLYAKTIVRNLSFILQKRSSLISMVPYEDVDTYLMVEEEELPENVVSKELQLAYIRKVWAQIPVEDRLILEQKYVLGWSDKELAATLGIQASSVRMRLTRAKRKVIVLLKEQGFQISDWF